MVQNPTFISSKSQFYGPPKSYKNASKAKVSTVKQAKANMPKTKVVQADTLQSGGIDNAGGISQGLFKGVKIKTGGYLTRE